MTPARSGGLLSPGRRATGRRPAQDARAQLRPPLIAPTLTPRLGGTLRWRAAVHSYRAAEATHPPIATHRPDGSTTGERKSAKTCSLWRTRYSMRSGTQPRSESLQCYCVEALHFGLLVGSSWRTSVENIAKLQRVSGHTRPAKAQAYARILAITGSSDGAVCMAPGVHASTSASGKYPGPPLGGFAQASGVCRADVGRLNSQ